MLETPTFVLTSGFSSLTGAAVIQRNLGGGCEYRSRHRGSWPTPRGGISGYLPSECLPSPENTVGDKIRAQPCLTWLRSGIIGSGSGTTDLRASYRPVGDSTHTLEFLGIDSTRGDVRTPTVIWGSKPIQIKVAGTLVETRKPFN